VDRWKKYRVKELPNLLGKKRQIANAKRSLALIAKATESKTKTPPSSSRYQATMRGSCWLLFAVNSLVSMWKYDPIKKPSVFYDMGTRYIVLEVFRVAACYHSSDSELSQCQCLIWSVYVHASLCWRSSSEVFRPTALHSVYIGESVVCLSSLVAMQ
jgi:hypothetical protein